MKRGSAIVDRSRGTARERRDSGADIGSPAAAHVAGDSRFQRRLLIGVDRLGVVGVWVVFVDELRQSVVDERAAMFEIPRGDQLALGMRGRQTAVTA
ncbi:MAG: hypothetical protein ACREIA_14570 [Opitutaceae bacterium]